MTVPPIDPDISPESATEAFERSVKTGMTTFNPKDNTFQVVSRCKACDYIG